MHPVVIREILGHYPRFAQPEHEPLDLGNAGGLSGARFWRFGSALGELVLRRWPAPGPSAATLRRNHDWIRLASPLRFVPAPILAVNGATFLEYQGHFWELQPWMSGTPPAANPADPAQICLAFEALARFHELLAVDSREEISPGIVSRLLEVYSWLIQEFSILEQAIANRPADTAISLARSWLASARTQAPRIAMLLERAVKLNVRCQPCLKDIRREHWLFEGGRVSGLVDFGAMDRDSVATDLSRLTSDWFRDDLELRDLALKSYNAIRSVTQTEVELLEVFDQSSDLLLGGHWARWLLLDRRDFEDREAVIRGLTAGVQRVSRLSESRPRWS